MPFDIPRLRQTSQLLTNKKKLSPHEVVSYMGAMQSQSYGESKHAVALRAHCSETDVVAAINNAEIVRTWPMRGTIHLTASEDIRWMLALMSKRPMAGSKARMAFLGIDEDFIAKCRRAAIKILSGNELTRDEFYEEMKKHKIPLDNHVSYHVVWRLSQEGILCFGKESKGKQGLVLLEEWLAPAKELSRDESLKALAEKYIAARGPVTVHDFAWWTQLGVTDAKKAFSFVENAAQETYGETTYYFSENVKPSPANTFMVLPGFDEFVLGYKVRDDIIAKDKQKIIATVNGIFKPVILKNGRVLAIWKRTKKKDHVHIEVTAIDKVTKVDKEATAKSLLGYEKYAGLPAKIEWM